jgi:hypothetical protein
MKKLLTIAAGLTVMLAGVALAAPSPKATGGAQWDTATSPPRHAFISFNAQGDTTDAKGMVNLRVPETGVQFKGSVTCYSQSGNTARFSGVVDSNDVVNGLTHFRVTVQDNGEPAADATPDRIFTQRFTSAQNDCQNNPAPAADITDGNIQVQQ